MNRKTRYIPITGLAVASCIGNSYEDLILSLKKQQSGLKKNHRFLNHSNATAGEIDFQNQFFLDEAKLLGKDDSPLARLVFKTIRDLAYRTKVFDRYRAEEIGLFFGTSTAGIEHSLPAFFRFIEAPMPKVLGNFVNRSHQHGSIAKLLKREFPIRGTDLTISTACSSSANAIFEAALALKMGLLKACIAGGADVLTQTTLFGFNSLQILDHEQCNPFSKNRKGINLADGGAFILLENCETPYPPVAYFAGAGASSDGYHMTQPDPSGTGMTRAIQLALKDAQISPDQISYVNAHGTGTIHNDEAESLAISKVLGPTVPVSSTKGFHGHLLGGSGAMEAVISLSAILEQTSWRGITDFSNLDFKESICHATGESSNIEFVLSNSFGFGGSNTSLIFSRKEKLI